VLDELNERFGNEAIQRGGKSRREYD